MPSSIADLITQLQSPNNLMTNALRSGMNTAVASGSKNVSSLGADQGWGGRSGMTAKLQTQNQNQGLETLGQELASLEGTRMGQLSSLTQAEEQNKIQREQMAQQLAMFMQQLQFQKDQANQTDWGKILGDLGMGFGSLLGGPFGGELGKAIFH
jgi:hypothetical protein